MDSTAPPAEPHAVNATSPNEFETLVEDARALQRAARAGTTRPLLLGKRYGLLCGTDEAQSSVAVLFDHAAVELGAQVAHIQPGLTERSAAQDVQQTAHLLGRLYDAIVCAGMAPALVQRLRVEAGVPVYDHLTSPDHPIAQAAGMLDPAASVEDNRRFALQALLLKATA
jgi:ornithine carbamoyltransferase